MAACDRLGGVPRVLQSVRIPPGASLLLSLCVAAAPHRPPPSGVTGEGALFRSPIGFASSGAPLPSALGLAAQSGLSSEAAPPAPKRLAVLPVLVGDPERLTVSSAFLGTLRAAELRPVRVMSVDDYFFQDGRELSQRARACGEDTGCLADALAVFQADLGLVLIAHAEVVPPLLGLVLVDTARRAVLADRYEVLEAGSFPDAVARAAAHVLEEAGISQYGRLEVVVDPSDAVVEVAEGTRPEPGSGHLFTLAPGRYPVRVLAPGHTEATREVEVLPGAVTRLDLRLEPAPDPLRSPWLWGSLAFAALAAGVVTALVLVEGQSPEACLCIRGRGDEACLRCP